MELNSYFTDFLADIRLPEEYADECRKGHEVLRKRLEDDPKVAPIVVSTFLQGSYKRGTSVRPNYQQRADVDVVLVSKLDKEEYTPEKVFPLFTPFLERHYRGRYRFQGRSIGISLENVDLDLVVTAAPSESELDILKSESVVGYETLEEAKDWRLKQDWLPTYKRSQGVSFVEKSIRGIEEWRSEPLYIPDREAKIWERTHPLAQIQWTRDKNGRCNGHYINVVKALKWWHRRQKNMPKYPKGYLIEHLIGVTCSDGVRTVAEGVTRALETITVTYERDAADSRVPYLPDHGVPEHNVFKRVSGYDFAKFYIRVVEAARIARHALDSTDLLQSVAGWKQLFGDDFPDAPPDDGEGGRGPDKGGFTARAAPSVIAGGRFA